MTTFLQRNLLLSTVVVIMSFDIVFLQLDYIASISSRIITLSYIIGLYFGLTK